MTSILNSTSGALSFTFKLRRDTAARWTAKNPVLAAGEPGYESDTGNLKVGDGQTAWTNLAYFEPTAGHGIVTSVNGQSGTVTLTAADVGADASGAAATAQANAETYAANQASAAQSAAESYAASQASAAQSAAETYAASQASAAQSAAESYTNTQLEGYLPTSDLPISIDNGGTGATSASAALAALGGVPLTYLPLGIANGGTGATSQQGALNAIAGGVTSGQYLRGNGSDVELSVIQAADVPTLNQDTTGTANNALAIAGIAVSGTPSSGQVLTATSATAAGWQPPSGGGSGAEGGIDGGTAAADIIPAGVIDGGSSA